MAAERGLEVDHTPIYRWVIKFTPTLEKAIRQLKRPVGKSWRLDETYFKVSGSAFTAQRAKKAIPWTIC